MFNTRTLQAVIRSLEAPLPQIDTYRCAVWGDIVDRALNRGAVVDGVALRDPAVVFLVPSELHSSVLKPGSNLEGNRFDQR